MSGRHAWRGCVAGSTARRSAIAFVMVSCLWSLTACGSVGGAIEVDRFPDDSQTDAGGAYTIGPGDMLNVQVYSDDKLSGRVRVRSDGRISIALLNDIEAAGKTPPRLATDIEDGLKSVIVAPRVTVIVEESAPLSISVIGEVTKPGPLTLHRGAGVAEALAAAGGFTAFAHRDRIFVLRNTPQPTRIHITYKALMQNIGKAALFRLRTGDVVTVE